jgi:hypothetical protein
MPIYGGEVLRALWVMQSFTKKKNCPHVNTECSFADSFFVEDALLSALECKAH